MLLSRILYWAERTPLACAVADSTTTMSYAQLWSTAARIAEELVASGVVSGDRVAIQMDKNCNAIATLLGVWLSGAAYVPIDPRAPAARAGQILQDCQPRALIFAASQYEKLAAGCAVVAESVPSHFTVGPSSGRARELVFSATGRTVSLPAVAADATAYILYTSGSTGQPKGVELSHRAAHAFVDWACHYFALAENDSLTSFAPLSFDLSIFDIFAALHVGARTTLIAPEQLLGPLTLVDQLGGAEITTLYAVPSTVLLLLNEGGATQARLPKLRRLLYAGERFPVRGLVAAMAALPHTRFSNLFGPTETNVCCCHTFDQPPDETAADVPIGRACSHLQLELCDDLGQRVGPGTEGELCVAGPAVMSGYYGNSEANRRAFIDVQSPSPEDGPSTLRMYRTGDYARQDADGTFWFVGRRDRMIKRRGYRIELGEIEAALLRNPDICEAVATVQQVNDMTAIVAYVVLIAGSRLSPLTVRAHCGRLLLPYQVPDTVKLLPFLPRTLTGKLDFSAIAT